jgi:diphthine synthase
MAGFIRNKNLFYLIRFGFMTLNLVGLGLWDEKSLTIEGLEQLKESDKIYLETYTSKWNGSIGNLERMVGKKISSLTRSDLEENSEKILEESEKFTVSVIALGDPLVATTHNSLLIDAKKRKIKTKVIHNTSIYSAVSEAGLHLYKFGATVTIPFPEKTNNQTPKSIFDTIEKNQKENLHTLCLLDLISGKNKYMSPNEAIETILKFDKIKKQDEIVVFGRASSKEPLIMFGKIEDLLKKDFGNPPFVLIVPGKLHFTEREYLDFYKV